MTQHHVTKAASPNPTYQEALKALCEAYQAQTNHEVHVKVKALVRHIEMLHDKKKVSPNELIAALNATTTLLKALEIRTAEQGQPNNSRDNDFSTALASYEKTAQKMQGSSSTALKVLGGLMIGVAIAALVAGIVIAPMLTMILAATVAATAASASSMAISGIAAAVALPAIGSLGFFAQSTRGGLSKAMGDVAQQVKNTPTEHVSDGAYAPM